MDKKELEKRRERFQKIKTGVLAAVILLCGGWYYCSGEYMKAEISYGNQNAESSEYVDETILYTNTVITKEEISVEEEIAERYQEESEGISSETENIHDNKLINLNSADEDELTTLPRIGPATAKLIIEYREEYGGFAAKEEIKNVKRIGDKTYEKLKDKICV